MVKTTHLEAPPNEGRLCPVEDDKCRDLLSVISRFRQKMCAVPRSLATHNKLLDLLNAKQVIVAGLIPRRSSCNSSHSLVENTRIKVPFCEAVATKVPGVFKTIAARAFSCATICLGGRLVPEVRDGCPVLGDGESVQATDDAGVPMCTSNSIPGRRPGKTISGLSNAWHTLHNPIGFEQVTDSYIS